MTILGIHMGHDPSITLIRHGEIVAVIEEEKLSRKKGEIGFPIYAFQYILTHHGVKPSDIDCVAFADRVYNAKTKLELKTRLSGSKRFRRVDYLRRVASYLNLLSVDISENNKAFFEKNLRGIYGLKKCSIIYYPHHLCHAASAYYTCPFTADLSITCDGRGETDAFNP